MEDLPGDLLAAIFSFVDVRTVTHGCVYVCLQFNIIVKSDAVWEKVYRQVWDQSGQHCLASGQTYVIDAPLSNSSPQSVLSEFGSPPSLLRNLPPLLTRVLHWLGGI